MVAWPDDLAISALALAVCSELFAVSVLCTKLGGDGGDVLHVIGCL